MTLETPRLTLQPFTPNDLDDLVQLHADPEVNRYLIPTGAWSREISKDKLERFMTHWEAFGYGRFSVRLKDDTFIGQAGFAIWKETDETELGYAFTRSVWGNGYATEVSRALLHWVFEMTDLEHVIGFAAEENVASRKVLENVGMTFTDIRPVNGIPFAFYKVARVTKDVMMH